MKHLLLLLALVLAAPLAHAQTEKLTYGAYGVPVRKVEPPAPKSAANEASNPKLDYNNGFRDFHFGDAITQHSGLKQVFANGESKVYEKKPENLKAGGADLESINYVFTNGKLTSIIIAIKGQMNSDLMKIAMMDQYGFVEESTSVPGTYDWHGKKVVLSFREATLDREDAQVMYVGLN